MWSHEMGPSQAIAIDEPNSFLHPDAARTLIRILKQHPQHQYIITTHSPEVIAEADAKNLFVLKHKHGDATEINSMTEPS
jgi:predicted ATP-dependent endonuclease of OLD family